MKVRLFDHLERVPDTAEINRQTKLLGLNYLLACLFFGTMSAADANRSRDLFAAEVMPRLAKQ